jgi:DNA-cytosine methyltransferase
MKIKPGANTMAGREYGITVIDLFSGAGGFSEGFRQAGFDVVMGIDNWKPACDTHETNGFSECKNINLLGFGIDDILALKRYLGAKHGEIDVIIGSPPCTEFSYAKKGGKGNIEKGMLLVREHLLFVALFKPRYWLMENVPRLEKVLDKECEGSRERGWNMPFEKLGIPEGRLKELGLKADPLHISNGVLLTASHFGACQNRKRFIAGSFPVELLEGHKVDRNTDVSLGGLLERLKNGIKAAGRDGYVNDPNYPHHRIKRSELRDHGYDTSLHPMYWEEMRHLKRRHIQYGKMHFPEDLYAPARTIMATYNSSSRESLVLDTGKTIEYQGKDRPVFRQPTVREVACIQGFPLGFQLKAPRIGDRYKLVGNAVPCQMSHVLAKAICDHIRRDKPKTGHDGGFSARSKVTLTRQEANKSRPIIIPPKEVVCETVDLKKGHMRFRASPQKHIRRKLLSSKLEEDSCVVIFENTDFVDGRKTGGPNWKSCIQKGGGKRYHKVYLDENSVSGILSSFDATSNPDELRTLLKHLLREAGKGIPVLENDWNEFPGWANGPWAKGPEKYLSFITGRRLKIPSVSEFQKTFTSDILDIGNIAGPIDFFDGLDAMMLSVFSKFKHLRGMEVYIHSLKDNGSHPHWLDPRITPEIRNVQIPLATLMGGLLSVHVLHTMYTNDNAPNTSGYSASLETADKEIIKWCGPIKR